MAVLATHREDVRRLAQLMAVARKRASEIRLRSLSLLILAIVILVGLLGCSVIAPAPTPSPTTLPQPTPTPEPFVLPAPPPLQIENLHRRVNPPTELFPTAVPATPHPESNGNQQHFFVPSERNAIHTVSAHLVARTPHANWYVQNGIDVSSADLTAAAEAFEQDAFPTVQRMLGWKGLQSDGRPERLTILLGHLAPADFGVRINVDDLLPRWIARDSNERSMIYVSTDNVQLGLPSFACNLTTNLAYLAWETAHPNQNYWVSLGVILDVGHAAGCSLDSILPPSAIGLFDLAPQTQLNAITPTHWTSGSSAFLAANALFARYVADRFGATSVFPLVFAASARGVAAYDRAFRSLAHPTTFDAVFGDWVAANYLDDPSLAKGRFSYRGNVEPTIQAQPGPTLVESVGGQASQFGASYYRIDPKQATTLHFVGDRTVKLVGADPKVGGYEWWSNRGDRIDSRLTRTVDLRAVKKATLSFWSWFDIEKNFDYAYVEVSTDGGTTWRTLATPDTTVQNPHGANLGNGFTGTSGGASPRWIHESIDLTPFVGREILLRFEYVTDEAVEGDGIVIDGVEIPQINFHDSAATDSGWHAEGFVRTDNLAPQPWLVEVLSHDKTDPVRRLTIAADGTGSIPLKAGQPVVVAVAGLAPDTHHRAVFQLRLLPRATE